MDWIALVSLVGFVFLMIATPGPANLVLIGAGAKYGYLKNLPFIFGLMTGKALLNLAIGLGLAKVLSENNTLNLIFSVISASYLIYLAFLSFKKNPSKKKLSDFSFLKGLILHPLNPKAWMMLVLAYSNFADLFDASIHPIVGIGLVFLLVQFVCHSGFCLIGKLATGLIEQNPWLNQWMAILTVGMVLYLLFF